MRNIAYIVCSMVVLLSSCGQQGVKQHKQSEILGDSIVQFRLSSSSLLSVADLNIQNNSNKTKSFYLSPSKYDFGSYQKLVSSIMPQGVSDQAKAHAIFNFIQRYTSHSNPIMQERLPHDPLRLVNSFQSGLCDDRNTALSILFSQAGFKSRVYHLNGHIVTEAYYDSAWHMYDADWNIYFYDSLNKVASVEYLEQHPEIISMDRSMGYNLRNVLGPIIFRHLYGTANDNKVNNWFSDVALDYENKLVLQPGDALNVHIEKLNWEGKLRKLFIDHAITDTRHWASLKRSIKMQRDYHLHTEHAPYAITRISISNAAGNDKPVAVYYSCNDSTWIFKGVIGGGSSNITFAPTDANGEKVVFDYKLNFVSRDGKAANSTFTVTNSVLVSEKIFLNDDKGFKIIPLGDQGKLDMDLHFNYFPPKAN